MTLKEAFDKGFGLGTRFGLAIGLATGMVVAGLSVAIVSVFGG